MFIKKYLSSNLPVTKSEILGRTTLIEEATKGQTKFHFDGDLIIRTSKNLNGIKPRALSNIHLEKLAQQMDYFSSIGLIHGDLHLKNLLVNNDDIHIIDWEPSLRQMIGNLNTLMYTAPWIDPEDKESRELSINTDLMCFYRLKKHQKHNFFKANDWFWLKKIAKNDKIPFTLLNKELPYEFTSKIKQKRSL